MEKEMYGKEYILFPLADFYQNAGVVGLLRLLEYIEAEKNRDYIMEENGIWVEKSFLQSRDLAKDYIDVFNATYEKDTRYKKALNAIDTMMYLLAQEDDTKEHKKKIDECFKEISTPLKSNSFKAGYTILAEKGIFSPVLDILLQLKQEKTLDTLTALKDFLEQEPVYDVLCFKSVIYSITNMFWENKAFLLKTNAAKDMHHTFAADFTDPLQSFVNETIKKPKVHCIACDSPISGKSKVSIAFAKDFADDLNRKKSAFWNFNVDAFICPLCAFLYALAPLGFVKVGNDMVFVNCNDSVQKLSDYNRSKEFLEDSLNKNWSRFYNEVVFSLLEQEKRKINNIQVVIRRRYEDKYRLSIIGKDVIQVVDKANKPLKNLQKWSSIKESKDSYINGYLETVNNLIDHRNQYSLIYRIFKIGMVQPSVLGCAANVISVQAEQTRLRKGEQLMNKNQLYFAAKEGDAFRKSITGGEFTEADNKLRGLTLQLLNDLHVNNRRGFLEKLLRLYTSYNLPMPTVFTQNVGDEEDFLNLGYQYLLGLKGGFYGKKEGE